ncbi:Calpain-10 [Collichthys lucidus]|nr:Calpain-10 [Collichthys lucidus]
MKEECRTESPSGGEALFEDPDFPSEDTSLFCDSSTPIARLQGDITWLRPQEICQSPVLFPDNINLGHAKQGLLGDCWFLCACAFLLKNKHLLNKVFPPDQPQWADSRLHSSYERLWAGQVSEALVDLTGGLAERWSLGDFGSEEEQRPEQDSDQVRRRRLDLSLLYPVKDQCAISCSTHSSPGGASELGEYHALTVMEWLAVKTVSESEVLLLRIRNPWGRCCWGGDWIGSGAGWSSVDPVSALDLQARVAEGEFWLDETEFLSQFDDVTVGYPISDEGHLKSIYTGNLLTHNHQLAGRWIKGHSAGGSRNSSNYGSNPKFWLKVCERGEVLVSLLQHRKWRSTEKYAQKPLEDSKNTKHQHYQAIALHMWKVEKKRFNLSRMLNKPPCASTHCHAYEREVVLHGQLESGYYLLIASTYQPGAEARFLIRCPENPSTFTAINNRWRVGHQLFPGLVGGGKDGRRKQKLPVSLAEPALPFTVCDESAVTSGVNVRITLHQSHPETDLQPIGFHIYKFRDRESGQTLPRDEDLVASCVPHCYTQDVSLACCLSPGAYTIVPSTYQPDCSANFTLSLARRIHSLKDDDSGDHDQDQGSPKDSEKEKNEDEDKEQNISKKKMVVPGAGEHPLQYNYTFWYSRRTPGRPASTQSYEQNIKQIGSFASVEQFWRFYSHMIRPGDLTGHSDFHLFKEGIKPMWEDDANKMGGKWIIRLRKGLASRCWENLILAMLGEQFMVGEEICGAVVSVRFQEDIISIWNKTASDQATTARIRDTLRRVLNLPPNTIMEYKTHTDSIKAWEDFHGLVNASGGR